jgi:hypothetical protein
MPFPGHAPRIENSHGSRSTRLARRISGRLPRCKRDAGGGQALASAPASVRDSVTDIATPMCIRQTTPTLVEERARVPRCRRARLGRAGVARTALYVTPAYAGDCSSRRFGPPGLPQVGPSRRPRGCGGDERCPAGAAQQSVRSSAQWATDDHDANPASADHSVPRAGLIWAMAITSNERHAERDHPPLRRCPGIQSRRQAAACRSKGGSPCRAGRNTRSNLIA